MPYVKNVWVNGDASKPLDETRLNHNEDGTFIAMATAESAAATALAASTTAAAALPAADLDADTAALVGDTGTATGAALTNTIETDIRNTRTVRPVALSSDIPADREYPTLVNAGNGPIFEFGVDTTAAASIYFPCLVSMPDGTYTLFYSSDHAGTHASSGVYAATAPSLFGPWVDRGLVWRDDGGGTQCETPSVWRDEIGNRWLMLYSLRTVPGANADQVTMIAETAAPDALSGWSRIGIAMDIADMDEINVNPHTGYAKQFPFGNSRMAYSLFTGNASGTRYGRYMKWQSDAAGVTWRPSLPVWGWPNALHHIEGYDHASFWNIKWFLGEVFQRRGQLWWIGLAGASVSGGDTTANRIVTFPLRPDLRGPAALPVDVTPDVAPGEDPDEPIDYMGNAATEDGRMYIITRSGGPQGAFFLKEVI